MFVVVLLALMPSFVFAQAGLRGPDRNQFVEQMYQGCFQVEDAKKKGLDLVDLRRYCVCLSNAIADRITPHQLSEIRALGPGAASAMRPMVTELAKTCFKQ